MFLQHVVSSRICGNYFQSKNFKKFPTLLLKNASVYITLQKKKRLWILFSKGFDDFAEFTFTSRGHRKLIHNQFYYNKSCETKTGKIDWRCALSHSYPTLKCRAKAVTTIRDGYEMLKIVGQHTHSANYKDEKRRLI